MAVTTYLEAIQEGIWEEMERDERVFMLGEDVGIYGGAFKVTEGMLDHFGPTRVIDTPISESAIVGAAIGAAMIGMRPVAEMQFIDFISCAFDQIINFAAKSRYRWGAGVPIVVRGPCGGGVHGGPFHSQNVEIVLLHTPGLKIVQPATAYDAKGLIKAAIRDPDPVLYFEHKYLYRRIKEELPDGRLRRPDRQGRSCAARARTCRIITYGAMVYTALRGGRRSWRKEASSVEVLDLRTLLPLGSRRRCSTAAKKTSKVHRAARGTRSPAASGGEIAARIAEKAFEYLDGPDRARRAAGHPGAVQPAAGGGLPAPGARHRRTRARAGGVLLESEEEIRHGDRCHHAPDGREHRRGNHRQVAQEGRRHGRARRAAVRDLHRQGRRRDPVAGRRRPAGDPRAARATTVEVNTVVAPHRRGRRSRRAAAAAPASTAPAPAPRGRQHRAPKPAPAPAPATAAPAPAASGRRGRSAPPRWCARSPPSTASTSPVLEGTGDRRARDQEGHAGATSSRAATAAPAAPAPAARGTGSRAAPPACPRARTAAAGCSPRARTRCASR